MDITYKGRSVNVKSYITAVLPSVKSFKFNCDNIIILYILAYISTRWLFLGKLILQKWIINYSIFIKVYQKTI